MGEKEPRPHRGGHDGEYDGGNECTERQKQERIPGNKINVTPKLLSGYIDLVSLVSSLISPCSGLVCQQDPNGKDELSVTGCKVTACR